MFWSLKSRIIKGEYVFDTITRRDDNNLSINKPFEITYVESGTFQYTIFHLRFPISLFFVKKKKNYMERY